MMLGWAMASLPAPHAQSANTIQYTDLDDLNVWHNNQEYTMYTMDLDHDGRGELELRAFNYELAILPVGSNATYAISVQPPDLGSYAVPLPAGAMIGPAPKSPADWIPFTPNEELEEAGYGSFVVTFYGGGYPTAAGLFAGKDAYLGFKFHIDGEPHYGWMHLITTNLATAWITEYAWETRPNTPILAGATTQTRPLLKMALSTTNGATITSSAIPGLRYRIEYLDDLRLTNWTTAASETVATNSSVTIAVPLSQPQAQRFYRVLELP